MGWRTLVLGNVLGDLERHHVACTTHVQVRGQVGLFDEAVSECPDARSAVIRADGREILAIYQRVSVASLTGAKLDERVSS